MFNSSIKLLNKLLPTLNVHAYEEKYNGLYIYTICYLVSLVVFSYLVVSCPKWPCPTDKICMENVCSCDAVDSW